MRILMLSPDAQMIDRRILQEARSLQGEGHHVTVLSGFECAVPDAYEEQSGVIVKRYTFDWSDLRRVKLRSKFGRRLGDFLWLWIKVADKVQARAGAFEAFVQEKVLEHEFDVLHVHDFPLLRAGCNAAKRNRAPVVYDSHEFYPVQSCFTPDQQKRFLELERKLVRSCHSVITVNPYIAKMMAKAHAIAEPLVLLNATPRLPFAPFNEPQAVQTRLEARRKARTALSLPADAFIFVYQGWISPERNLESMIRAMKDVPQPAVLVIVGYGDHVAVLRQIANDLGLGDRVIFYGRVESEDLPSLTAVSDVGVIPYLAVDEMHRYCSPNKLFEFVSAGIPIIASDLPYLRDVIGGYDIGWLCDTGTPETLAQTMREAISEKQVFGRFESNMTRAQDDLNWDVEEKKLFQLYDRLAALLPKRTS